MSTLNTLLRQAAVYSEKFPFSETFAAKSLHRQPLLHTKLDAAEAGFQNIEASIHFLLESFGRPLIIDESLIFTLHRLNGGSDTYRLCQKRCEITGFSFPAPEEIPRLIEHLSSQTKYSSAVLSPLELAAMVFKRVADICPFEHGSLLTAELLMNMILIHFKYIPFFLPLSCENDYFKALSSSRRLKDMDIFSEFIVRCLIQSYENFEQ